MKEIYAMTKVHHKIMYRSGFNRYRGFSFVAHAGNVMLKIVASRLSNGKDRGIFP